jgi:hypothetical protein
LFKTDDSTKKFKYSCGETETEIPFTLEPIEKELNNTVKRFIIKDDQIIPNQDIVNPNGPYIKKTEFKHSAFGRYPIQEYWWINQDTILITFSEKIYEVRDERIVWNSLILFIPDCADIDSFYPLELFEKPYPVSEDSLTWQFVPNNIKVLNYPEIGDCIYFNPDALFQNADGNRPSNKIQIIEGENKDITAIYSVKSYPPVIGFNIDSIDSTLSNEDIEKYLYGIFEFPLNFNKLRPSRWTPPAYFQDDGTIDEKAQEMCLNTIQVEKYIYNIFNSGCLSSVLVFSEVAYTAEIEIFDHGNNRVHASVQRFGYCGEFLNLLRSYPEGWGSWLVWNLKDLNDKYVKPGIYTWKIKFKIENLDDPINVELKVMLPCENNCDQQI